MRTNVHGLPCQFELCSHRVKVHHNMRFLTIASRMRKLLYTSKPRPGKYRLLCLSLPIILFSTFRQHGADNIHTSLVPLPGFKNICSCHTTNHRENQPRRLKQ